MRGEHYYVAYSDWSLRYRSTVVPYSFEPFTAGYEVSMALAGDGYATREEAEAVADLFNEMAGL